MYVRKRRAHTLFCTHSALGISHGFSFISWPSRGSSLLPGSQQMLPVSIGCVIPGPVHPPHPSLLLTLSQLVTECRPVCLYTHQIVPSGWA